MSITATSTSALAVKSVIDLLAKSDTFQERIADFHEIAKSEANARLYIFGSECNFPAERDESGAEIVVEKRPFAVVGLGDQSWNQIVNCSVKQYLPSGVVLVALTDQARFTDCFGPDAPDDYNDSYLDALNFFGGVVDDLNATQTTTDAAFPPSSIRLLDEIHRTDTKHRVSDGDYVQDYWTAFLAFEFGEGSGGGG